MIKRFTILTGAVMIFLSARIYPAVYYVSLTGSNGSATSWATAKTSIQSAINAASNGDVILVKYGTYYIYSYLTLGSKNLKITSDIGTANSWETAKPDSSQCIINAGNYCRIFTFNNSAITTATVIRGFKITGGDAGSSHAGGGIAIYSGADPIIERCWISNNKACTSYDILAAMGGGIFVQDGSPIIRNNLIEGNVATTVENTGSGGGIAIWWTEMWSTPAEIRDNIITGNYATQAAYSTNEQYFGNFGGGIYLWGSNVIVSGNKIISNVCAYRPDYKKSTYTSVALGGGIAVDGASATISNNIFNGNQALVATTGVGGNPRGGAIYLSGLCTIVNNTFYDNRLKSSGYSNYGSRYGQGIYSLSSSPTIKNNIFINHSTSYGDGVPIYATSAITVNYNCFYNNGGSNVNVTSNNGITSNPLFNNPTGGDFNLQTTSPCINAGDPTSSVPAGGEPVIDLGANEFIGSSPAGINNLDNSFDGNFISGHSVAIASESGTINCTAQLNLSSPPNNPEGKSHIGRYWDISSTGNAKIRLYYPCSATSGFTGKPTIFHYDGSNWAAVPTSDEQTEGTCMYVESTEYITSWSPFTVGDGDAPLPVELQSFRASVNQNAVTLYWQTSTEVNNYGFEIQRSEVRGQKSANAAADPSAAEAGSRTLIADSWNKIGFVDGHGNSNSVKKYSFVDENVSSGKYYYRLKQIDNDGAFKYSEEIEVEMKVPLRFALEQNYPNPFNPTTAISYQLAVDSHVLLKVYNILGEEVRTLVNEHKKAGAYTFSFDARGLSNGVYLYRITAGKNSDVKKMIVLK